MPLPATDSTGSTTTICVPSMRAAVASPPISSRFSAPFGVRRVVSSPYVRCVQTVEPLAAALGLEVEQDDRLEEGAGAAAADLLSEDGVVCCTHGDVVEAILGRGLKKGAAVVLDDGAVVREIPPPK